MKALMGGSKLKIPKPALGVAKSDTGPWSYQPKAEVLNQNPKEWVSGSSELTGSKMWTRACMHFSERKAWNFIRCSKETIPFREGTFTFSPSSHFKHVQFTVHIQYIFVEWMNK